MNIEPAFLGVKCSGTNSNKAKKLREEAQNLMMLSKFFLLDRKEQLIIAAVATEMLENRAK